MREFYLSFLPAMLAVIFAHIGGFQPQANAKNPHPSPISWATIYAEKARVYFSEKKTFSDFVQNNNFPKKIKEELQDFITKKELSNTKIPRFLHEGARFTIMDGDQKLIFDFSPITKKQISINGKIFAFKAAKSIDLIEQEINSLLTDKKNNSTMILPLIESAIAADDGAKGVVAAGAALIKSIWNEVKDFTMTNVLALDLKQKMDSKFTPYEFHCSNSSLMSLSIITKPEDMAGYLQFKFTHRKNSSQLEKIATTEPRLNGEELTCTYQLQGMGQIKAIQSSVSSGHSACAGTIGNQFQQEIMPLLPYESLHACCKQEDCVNDMKKYVATINEKIKRFHSLPPDAPQSGDANDSAIPGKKP